MTVRILTVAEFDANGFSGIQADMKTAMALGGYATTAATALAAHAPGGISILGKIEPSSIAAQMTAALEGVGADAVKIGFLEDAASVHAVADVLDGISDRKIPIVIDPSIVLRNGSVLIDEKAINAWKHRLYTLATVITPSLAEVGVLSGIRMSNVDEMVFAASVIRSLGATHVVVKCGRALGDKERYIVATENGTRIFEQKTVEAAQVFGAGSTFSAALATFLARKMDIFPAVEGALGYLQRAIETAEAAGFPKGALNHATSSKPRSKS